MAKGRANFEEDEEGTRRIVRFDGTLSDITERKRAVESLIEADRRKDEFLATLAHELRNPLAPIRTGLELLGMVGEDPTLLEEIRSTMENQTKQLVRLVDDLLDVSRITIGKFELREEELVLTDIGMPKLNGYELARKIRKQSWGTGIQLVALTGWGQDSDKALSKEAGFDKHLVKPAEPSTIKRLLAELGGSADER